MAGVRKYPPIETLDRLRHWCAMQERAHSDVRHKLASWGVFGEEVEQAIGQLITEGYLNEERFARTYAEGKFRMKHWGWKKIELGLRQKGISSYSMASAKQAYEALDQDSTLKQLLLKKQQQLRETDPRKRKMRLLRYALSKGYTHEEVYAQLNALA